jgi:hypothetical protein
MTSAAISEFESAERRLFEVYGLEVESRFLELRDPPMRARAGDRRRRARGLGTRRWWGRCDLGAVDGKDVGRKVTGRRSPRFRLERRFQLSRCGFEAPLRRFP